MFSLLFSFNFLLRKGYLNFALFKNCEVYLDCLYDSILGYSWKLLPLGGLLHRGWSQDVDRLYLSCCHLLHWLLGLLGLQHDEKVNFQPWSGYFCRIWEPMPQEEMWVLSEMKNEECKSLFPLNFDSCKNPYLFL